MSLLDIEDLQTLGQLIDVILHDGGNYFGKN